MRRTTAWLLPHNAIFGPAGAVIMGRSHHYFYVGCNNGFDSCGSRVAYAMAKDGLVLPRYGKAELARRSCIALVSIKVSGL